MNTLAEDIKKLSISERIEIVEDIWNSIANDGNVFRANVTDQQLQQLQHRYQQHLDKPATSKSWQQVRSALFSRNGD